MQKTTEHQVLEIIFQGNACYIHDLNGHNLEAVFIDKEASK